MRKLDRMHTAGVFVAFVALAFILAGPTMAKAQSRKPVPSPPLKPPTPETSAAPPNLRTADQATMEMNVLMARRWTAADVEREQRRANAQLSQDIERLGQLESESIAPVLKTKSIDYGTLAQVTREIKDRASRIKFSSPIVLKDRGQKLKPEADPGKLGLMLPQLSRAIKAFVGNPALRVNSPNDAELRSTAGHDLEAIIKLSDTITRIAKGLNKTLVASK